MESLKKEICTIRIMFPVESDEQAIDCKSKINAIVSEIPNAETHFSIIPIPKSPKYNGPNP